jgi:hypothetical protein
MRDVNDTAFGGGRCAACDAVLEVNEVYWVRSRNEFESLCSICRRSVREALREMDVGSWEPEQ